MATALPHAKMITAPAIHNSLNIRPACAICRSGSFDRLLFPVSQKTGHRSSIVNLKIDKFAIFADATPRKSLAKDFYAKIFAFDSAA
ncbi:MAG: hypothetical protein AAFQ59_07690 [Pseudomonadota bacterium]